MTLRVTKAQIDAFASGKVNAERFQKDALITAYTVDAAGAPFQTVTFGSMENFKK